ncbi:SDR family NAD(P)-dependent oxidoreductase [Subtercola endophyticus]|uniref:SDR family NAD(P)-dependent oxidoreductase n=1 Tax=Subtercola endophyticus TaxID=2895559 RepID=UPI001E41E2DE|nr:SDR family NAD(P)-dependent oxidoreductase [Subtercola endophyticus]UFS57543.1 SDR family NAD(P)-dependent oxidoreductase [Subtercola endophyticus]
MTKWTAVNMPGMTGRTVVVTGGSDGIGLIAAREFARAGARVILAVRNTDKGAKAAASMPGDVEVRQLDVSDLLSVRSFADTFTGDLDVLVNNAGIMDVPLSRTAEGYELQLATNYLGPFVLTNLLLPKITDRVVSVGSQLHHMGKLHLDDLNGLNRPYKGSAAYNDSKLDLMLFSTELQRRLLASGSTVRSMIAHPGIASTSLASHSAAGKVTGALRFLFNDPEHGALPTLFAATQDIPGNSYVGPDGLGHMRGYPAVGMASSAGLDSRTASTLWARTVELTGLTPTI